jgi:hypothetical protein
MFRHSYVAILRELKLKFFHTYSNKIGHNKNKNIVVSPVKNVSGFG